MATNTTNYNLIKPDYEDDADIKDLNDNFDTIDTAMNNLEEGKQAALTTAQMAAVNSGIDSAKVEQIETNKNNILLNWTTGKNIIKTVNPGTSDPSQASNFTITTNADNTFTISGSSTGVVLIGFEVTLPVGMFTISGCPSGGGTANYQVDLRNNSWSGVSAPDTGNGVQFTNNTAGTYKYVVRIAANYVCNNLLIKPMISTSTNTDYQPYAMSNAELTAAIQALQAQLANQ